MPQPASANGYTRGRYPISHVARNFAGVLIARGTVYAGFAGGKLIAINLTNGSVTWEAVVSRPRGATELERVTDVASLPVINEQQVCAVAYQGRVACFELATGNQIWARDVSSNAGLAMDNHYVYISEHSGAVVAYDKNDGSGVWRQDILNGLKLSPPLIRENYVIVADSQGYLNLIRNSDGSIVARSATDGSPVPTRPLPLPEGVAVQTKKGGVYAFSMESMTTLPPPGQAVAMTNSPRSPISLFIDPILQVIGGLTRSKERKESLIPSTVESGRDKKLFSFAKYRAR